MKMYRILVILTLVISTLPITATAETPDPASIKENASCPENLSHLHEEMEGLLRKVDVPEFIRTMRESLTASIPDTIQQIDGLKPEIAALQQEIQHQERVEKSAEFIARDVSNNPSGPLEPCRRRKKGGYCSTVERFYIAKAANLANRGFLEALQCYQQAGFR